MCAEDGRRGVADDHSVGSVRPQFVWGDRCGHHGQMPTDPPRDHVARAAHLPWRPVAEALTECGRPFEGLSVLTFEELDARIHKDGIRRAAYATCMTCLETAQRYRPWSIDPVGAVRREVSGMRGNEQLFHRELLALQALVDAHREEFSAYLHGLGEATSLEEHRRKRMQVRRGQ